MSTPAPQYARSDSDTILLDDNGNYIIINNDVPTTTAPPFVDSGSNTDLDNNVNYISTNIDDPKSIAPPIVDSGYDDDPTTTAPPVVDSGYDTDTDALNHSFLYNFTPPGTSNEDNNANMSSSSSNPIGVQSNSNIDPHDAQPFSLPHNFSDGSKASSSVSNGKFVSSSTASIAHVMPPAAQKRKLSRPTTSALTFSKLGSNAAGLSQSSNSASKSKSSKNSPSSPISGAASKSTDQKESNSSKVTGSKQKYDTFASRNDSNTHDTEKTVLPSLSKKSRKK